MNYEKKKVETDRIYDTSWMIRQEFRYFQK